MRFAETPARDSTCCDNHPKARWLLQASDGRSITEGALAEQVAQFYDDYQSSVSNAYSTVLKGPILA